MTDFPWLTALIVVPVLGAAITAVTPSPPGGALAKRLGLAFSGLTFAGALAVWAQYDVGAGMQLTEDHLWIEVLGAHYALGVDGLGLVMVLLTTLLVPVVLLASWADVDTRNTRAFVAWVLALEAAALAVFTATDVFLFYVAFEATLIPAYFLIGGFGGPARRQAAVKFLIYMLLGGLVMLVAVIGLYVESSGAGAPSYLVGDLAGLDIDTDTARWLFLGFFIAFAIKAPIFPVHTWLADMTASATPGTSVLLVCVLDKIGTYGMIRFCLGIFPEASQWATPVVVALALISIVYGALVAIRQDDMLRLIGLTSLSHFGFIVLGIFVFTGQGQTGAILYMVNHGLATAALFIVAGYLIRRRGTASIAATSGVEKAAPVLAGVLLVAGLATLGLPGLAPFVSEFLVILSALDYAPWAGAIAVTGIVLAAIYVLWFYQRTMTGQPSPEVAAMKDLDRREIGAIAPLLAALVFFGFYPMPLLDVINPTTDTVLEQVGVSDEPPTVPGAEEAGAGEAGADETGAEGAGTEEEGAR